MYTRKDYMENRCTHREYHAQFVNAATIRHVVARIGGRAIQNSTDPHLNDIGLGRWDGAAQQSMPMAARFEDFGDFRSLGGLVCVAKEAARQYLEGGLK